jgi:phytoene dehydrogenase-like protein
MMANQFDAVVVGAGHNGLTAAAYLAKAGKKVLVLERRKIVGGSVVTEEFAAGFRADAVWTGGTLRPDIVKDLALELPRPITRPPFVSLLGEGQSLVLDAEPTKAAESIRRFSEKDAARWPEFVLFMDRAAAFLDEAYATLMPRLPKGMSLREGLGLAEMGIDLRLMGRKDMLRFIRMLPMTAVEFLEE